jgi:hypothetical protein
MKIGTPVRRRKPANDSRKRRKGTIAAMTGFLLMAILGLVACALDIGWIEMTRTQLQAVADASSLAGGTELMPGLGYFKTKTPDEVVDAATPVAVEYAGYNRNAELASSFIDGGRDVKFGKATFDPVEREDGSEGCGCFIKTPADQNPEYYNYIEVTALRNQVGSTAGDGPAPLFFARIFGINDKSLRATATAAILPANGFQVNEGSDDTADVMPFAFNGEVWDKFLRAQERYNAGDANYGAHDPAMLADQTILDDVTFDDLNGNGVQDPGEPNLPLFWTKETQSPYTPAEQIMFDNRTVTDNVVSSGPDNHLELKVFPHKGVLTSDAPGGNFGTIDFGSTNNSTQVIRRQILTGLNENDLSYYPENQIVLTEEDPLDAEADSGISAGMQSALQAIIGKCRAIALFSSVSDQSGNNTIYTLVEFVSLTVVEVDLSSGDKRLIMQRCTLVDDNAVVDVNDIGDNTTIFTPLILIR